MEQPDSEFEVIAQEVERLGEAQEEGRRLLERLDAEMDEVWHLLGLRRLRRRREGSHRTTNRKD